MRISPSLPAHAACPLETGANSDAQPAADLGMADGFLRAECFASPALSQSDPIEGPKALLNTYAQAHRIVHPSIRSERMSDHTHSILRGYKTITGREVLMEMHALWGVGSVLILLVAADPGDLPTIAISNFLKSAQKRR